MNHQPSYNRALPPGWQVCYDPNGKPYYYTADGQVTWEFPTSPAGTSGQLASQTSYPSQYQTPQQPAQQPYSSYSPPPYQHPSQITPLQPHYKPSEQPYQQYQPHNTHAPQLPYQQPQNNQTPVTQTQHIQPPFPNEQTHYPSQGSHEFPPRYPSLSNQPQHIHRQQTSPPAPNFPPMSHPSTNPTVPSHGQQYPPNNAAYISQQPQLPYPSQPPLPSQSMNTSPIPISSSPTVGNLTTGPPTDTKLDHLTEQNQQQGLHFASNYNLSTNPPNDQSPIPGHHMLPHQIPSNTPGQPSQPNQTINTSSSYHPGGIYPSPSSISMQPQPQMLPKQDSQPGPYPSLSSTSVGSNNHLTQNQRNSQFGQNYTPIYAAHQAQNQENTYGQNPIIYNQTVPGDPQQYLHTNASYQGQNLQHHHPANMPTGHLNTGRQKSQPQPSKLPSAALSSQHSLISVGTKGAQPVMFVSLELKAVGLKNRDLLSKSDPLCKVSASYEAEGPKDDSRKEKHSSQWIRIGETEIISNSLCPSWTERIRVAYRSDVLQFLKFDVIDVDNFSKKTGQDLGSCTVQLSDIVRNGSISCDLTRYRNKNGVHGQLTIKAHDENAIGQVRVSITLGARNLDKKDRFGKSDPYYKLIVDRIGDQVTNEILCTSPVVPKNLNPEWKKQDVTIQTKGFPWSQISLCCKVFDHDKFKSHDFIGEAKFKLQDLHEQSKMFLVINPSRLGNKNYVNSGELLVNEIEIRELHNFISYLQGGMRLDFAVAVDFTASNKACTESDSLHFLGDPSNPNPYERALTAIGNTMAAYTADQTVTALGFGAILPGQAKASFDFSLSGHKDARVAGVKNLIDAYRFAAKTVTFSGPTFFKNIIQNAVGTCAAHPVTQTNQHFTVLVILTDGVISDMRDTIESIIDASYSTPIAISIVGIGNEDFSIMERLDGDKHKLKSTYTGREAKYDIVQFTKFNTNQSEDLLPMEILREVPHRVQEYMAGLSIVPNAPYTSN